MPVNSFTNTIPDQPDSNKLVISLFLYNNVNNLNLTEIKRAGVNPFISWSGNYFTIYLKDMNLTVLKQAGQPEDYTENRKPERTQTSRPIHFLAGQLLYYLPERRELGRTQRVPLIPPRSNLFSAHLR